MVAAKNHCSSLIWRAGRVSEVVDSSLSLRDSNEAVRCIQIGLLCVEETAAHRPDMQAVVLMLSSETTPIPSPKQPAFVSVRSETCSAFRAAIAANESIADGSLLISKGGKFALGFFSPGRSRGRYLGIWYHEIPNRTVVWVANRDNPISGTSGVLSLNGYCNLFLYSNSSSRLPAWSANALAGSKGPCLAQLLDSGNLVLMEGGTSKMATVWQSFDNPTDTFLPGMKVGLNRTTGVSRFLTSWRSVDDPGTGQFSYKLNPSGSPQLFLYRGINPYWRNVPFPWKSYELFNDSFVNNELELSYSYTPGDASALMRVVIDPLGLLKFLAWDHGDGEWKVFFSSPKQMCDFYGSCGPNGKCYSSIVFPYECACLPGYEPRYPRNWKLRDGSSGCVRKQLESSSICGSGEGFVRVEKVKIPDTSAAAWMNLSVSKLNCEAECRKNCSCSAYATYDNGKGTSCWTWHGELMDTVNLPVDAYDLYVRVDAHELVKNRRIRDLFHYSDGSTYSEDSLAPRDFKRSTIYPELPFFSLSTIHEATDNFSPANKLGHGGSSLVYKVKLLCNNVWKLDYGCSHLILLLTFQGKLSNGQEVAVKRLSKNSRQGLEQFKNEVLLIAKLQHRNLVKLYGCCIEEDEQMLVYEYLPYNSFDSLLFVDQNKRSILDWRKRFEIITGTARGILYLHQDSRFRIIHRDLKPSNILLDAELNPKISDFGMARMLDKDQVEGKESRICGTYGYMSPEYAVFGRFSVKSDVFSFGVILLETVSGKKSNGFPEEDASSSLIAHVWELWKADRAWEVIDASLSLKCSNEALRCIQIGLLCVEENAADRPDMLAVVLMLSSKTAPVPLPKQPAFVCVRSKS
ncbi:unnamed protein product [Linum tenue]|uniref:non-specific serine/threonine protein kinase n=1 Tax=Linum tenue TaxID=586396 RepID=A0AAV0PCD4_9ROSI|nr:unnamed protein product [Linum tenue]